MAFESLGDKLQGVFKKLRGKGKLNEKDIKDAMREIKLALLEADVNFKVVKEFVNIVSEKALGQEIMESLTPAQQLVKIVNEELTQMIGGEVSRLEFSQKPPTVIMMCGLQGAGKTTATGKLALNLTKKMNKRPLMVACDVYRPAAIKQLEVLGKQIQVPVFSMGADVNPVTIAKEAVAHAIKHGNDPVILDTAGRLHIDEQLMDELANIKAEVNPTEILLVVDAMTGQDAVNVAKSFNDQLDITGVILSKLDGDTRGGAALSVKQVTGKPIKYASVGEKLSDLEQFHPDRMASRILGMGDVLTLIDKAQETIDEKKAQELEEKIRKQQFDLDDFLEQFKQIRKMGSFSQILGMLPGIDKKMLESVDTEENEKKMLLYMAEGAELGDPCFKVLEDTGVFPAYVVRMAKLGQQSGTLDQMMESLADYYEKEYYMMKNIRNAIIYPVMMVGMLLIVLFVLFTRVMPVFEQVYAQLGVQMSPLSQAASRLGGILSGAALVVFVLLAVAVLIAAIAAGAGKELTIAHKLMERLKRNSKTALAAAGRRFTAVLALTIRSGMELDKGMELARELVDNGKVAEKIDVCSEKLQLGEGYYEAMKESGLFSSFHIQLIKVGVRSGKMDEVLQEISDDYEQQADASIDAMVARLEPTLVAVLAVAVGLILLSVMLPLAGILAGVG